MASPAPRKATSISLAKGLLDEARELGINVSRACERGLAEQIAETRRERWLEENREALESSNEWVKRNGLPLAKHRPF